MSDHSLAHIDEAEHGTIKSFTVVWIILLVLTGIEVLLAYLQVNPVIMLTILVGLSVVKAALIIAYFMHLKFERFSLFLTLFPMLIFCILMMMVFMPDSLDDALKLCESLAVNESVVTRDGVWLNVEASGTLSCKRRCRNQR